MYRYPRYLPQFHIQETISQDFPTIPYAVDLLKSMQANASFNSGEPSSDVAAFLDRIERADPNSAELSEDNTNQCWGHYHFTAGSLTCTTVLTSWRNIGNTNVACKLIAAAIKTAKVARHLCFSGNIQSISYLSDVYLSTVIDLLWSSWKNAGGVGAAVPGSTRNALTDIFKMYSRFSKAKTKTKA
jgi:hypothetical protein